MHYGDPVHLKNLINDGKTFFDFLYLAVLYGIFRFRLVKRSSSKSLRVVGYLQRYVARIVSGFIKYYFFSNQKEPMSMQFSPEI